MNKVITFLLSTGILLISSLTIAKESDESGIGGTGASNPPLEESLFSRPEIPEFLDTPEAPEISLPELDGALSIETDATIDRPENPTE